MLIKVQPNKESLSYWILGVFIVALFLSALNSIFFQAPTDTTTEFNRYRTLFTDESLSGVEEVQLKNRLGSFRVTKSKDGHWKLIDPRLLPAKENVINKIIETLKEIKIRKVFQKDPINISNFSLDRPLLSLTLSFAEKEKITVDVGLINPFDNSTYVIISDKDAIYDIDSLKFSLETLELTDFVDSKVLSLPAEQITSVHLYRKDSKNSSVINIYKDEEHWMDRSKNALDPEEVQQYLNSLAAIQSSFILDKQSEELQKEIDELLQNPLYTMEIQDASGNTYTYTISNLINKLTDVKLEKRQNFLIRASNRDHPYLLNKDILKTFNQSGKRFKKIPLKKLFY